MKFILKKLREARQREEGFTLIEMLIVILVLGILAGIAVFASEPFRARAEQACHETNDQIAIIADAAADAGVSGNLYADGPDCSGTGGGGGPVAFDAAFEDVEGTTTGTDDVSATVSAAADNLLVAVVAHRTTPNPGGSGAEDSSTVDQPTASAGWSYQGHTFFQANTGDRRGIAVFTRIADGTAGDDVTVSWPGTGAATVGMKLMVAEFSRTGDDPAWSNSGTYVATEAGGTTPYTLDPAAGSPGSALVLAGIVGRAGPSAGSFNGFDGTESDVGGTVNVGLYLGYNSLADADGAQDATISWTVGSLESGNEVSGFVLIMR